MSSVDNRISLQISLDGIKETGFSIRPNLKDSDLENIEWMIGFRPIISEIEGKIAVEVRSVAVHTGDNTEVGTCSVMLSFSVKDLEVFATKLSDDSINVKDHLMANMLNPAFGTLRGIMFTRFSGTPLERKPLPLIDVTYLIESSKKKRG